MKKIMNPLMKLINLSFSTLTSDASYVVVELLLQSVGSILLSSEVLKMLLEDLV